MNTSQCVVLNFICVYLCVYFFLEMYIKMKDNCYMMKTIAFLVGIVYRFQFHVICTELYAWFRLREVDREWALVMNHQISLPLTI